MKEQIRFSLNGQPVHVMVEGDRLLLWILRTDLQLTGTKYGCGESLCGACTVLIDKEPVRSCQVQVKDIAGKSVTTIEGLASDDKLHPVQKAFIEHDALQCGFCTPGMILNAVGFLYKNPNADRGQLTEAMEDNLCRCGSYSRIIDAITQASAELAGEAKR
jgi:carbon-monoxide dehydrogenase small subunit